MVNAQKRSTLSLYTYHYEEFDLDPAAKPALRPTFANFERIEYVDGDGNEQKALQYPTSLGFFYSRWINDKRGFRIDWHARYSSNKTAYYVPKRSGQSQSQQYTGLAMDYLWAVYTSPLKRLQFSAYAGWKGRVGNDVVFIENYPILTHYPERKLRDLGLRAGIIYAYHLPWNVTLSAEAGYSRWILLYFNQIERTSQPWKLPRNAFDMRISIGYSFGNQIPERDTTSKTYTHESKNRMVMSASIPYFFDSPGRPLDTHLSRSISKPLIGVKYERSLNKTWGVYARAGFEAVDYKDYSLNNQQEAPTGRTVFYREYLLLAMGVDYGIPLSGKCHLSIPADLVYRHGKEFFFERIESVWSRQFDQRDFGIGAGATITYHLWRQFEIGIQANYTRFVYRRDLVRIKDSYVKTSPNLASIGLSAGYKF